MTVSHDTLIKKTRSLPGRLEASIAGLSASQLSLKNEGGWSIREYVHHTVEGALIWQVLLRAVAGTSGITFPIDWYFRLPQDEWVKHWKYEQRDVVASLALFRGSIASLADLLEQLDALTWRNYGTVTWPGDSTKTRLSVRNIVEMDIGHVDQHSADILAIRKLHQV
jgi:hypothetical protein